MTQTKNAITVSNLKKRYQNKEVLKTVTFSVPSGITYALLGSNGAGKTTTIRILTTQIKADSGVVNINGYDVLNEPEKIHEIISLTGQFSAVDEALTGMENLLTIAKLRQTSNPEKSAVELLDYFELSDTDRQPVSTYSGGMKRKLDIAMSLIGNPKIIFLDEPTTGLDPQSRRNMWDIIKKLNRSGVTIFLTTQYLDEAEHLADKIAILDKGTIIAEGTVDELKAYLPQGAVQFVFDDIETLKQSQLILQGYKVLPFLEEYKLTVYTDGKAKSLTDIFHQLYQHGINIKDFSQITPNLEDVFLSIIKERE